MGTMANDLTLGCDCVGTIHYLVSTAFSAISDEHRFTDSGKPGAFIGHDGSAIIINRAVCIHEEDVGLLWKHTDYRPGGRSQAVRSRRLVISMCCTLANYGVYLIILLFPACIFGSGARCYILLAICSCREHCQSIFGIISSIKMELSSLRFVSPVSCKFMSRTPMNQIRMVRLSHLKSMRTITNTSFPYGSTR